MATADKKKIIWAEEDAFMGADITDDALAAARAATAADAAATPAAKAKTTPAKPTKPTTPAAKAGTPKAQAKGNSIGGRRPGANQNATRGPKPSAPRPPSLCRNGASCRFLKGGCLSIHSLDDYITAHRNMGTDFGTPKGLCPCGTSEACAAYFVGAPHGIICPNRLHRGQLLLTLDGTKVDASAVFDALNVVSSAFHQAPNTYVSNAAKREAEKTAKANAEAAAAEERAAKANRDAVEAEAFAAGACAHANAVVADAQWRANAVIAEAQWHAAATGFCPPAPVPCYYCQQGRCDGRNHQ
jgi:hypothetical protein